MEWFKDDEVSMGLQVLSDGVNRWFALGYPGFGAQRAVVYWPHTEILLVECNLFLYIY